MPELTTDLHRRLVEAFNGHDIEAVIALCDPSVEYHSAITVPGGTAYHGHDGVRRYFRDFGDATSSLIRCMDADSRAVQR